MKMCNDAMDDEYYKNTITAIDKTIKENILELLAGDQVYITEKIDRYISRGIVSLYLLNGFVIETQRYSHTIHLDKKQWNFND